MESSSQREELRSWPPSVEENLIRINFKSKTLTTSTFRPGVEKQSVYSLGC
jgi:hypothetical protein